MAVPFFLPFDETAAPTMHLTSGAVNATAFAGTAVIGIPPPFQSMTTAAESHQHDQSHEQPLLTVEAITIGTILVLYLVLNLLKRRSPRPRTIAAQ